MTRTLNNVFLITGAFAAFVALVVSIYNNAIPETAGTHGNLAALLEATLIAFSCAVIAIGTDLQNSVTKQLRTPAYTSVFQCWQGFLCLIAWGCFDAFMLQIVVAHPRWATQTFGFEVNGNLPWMGLIVGISAVVIIRSKLFKQGNTEWGAEWIYLWSSAQVLDAVNQRKIRRKAYWERRFKAVVSDPITYATFYVDLESTIRAILPGKNEAVAADLTQEFQRIRTTYAATASGQTADDAVNASIQARRYLVSAILDHLGHDELHAWAKQTGLTI